MHTLSAMAILSAARALHRAVPRRALGTRRRSLQEPPGLIDIGAFDRNELERFVVEDLEQPKRRAVRCTPRRAAGRGLRR